TYPLCVDRGSCLLLVAIVFLPRCLFSTATAPVSGYLSQDMLSSPVKEVTVGLADLTIPQSSDPTLEKHRRRRTMAALHAAERPLEDGLSAMRISESDQGMPVLLPSQSVSRRADL